MKRHKGLFVTATDTGAGKTTVAVLLTRMLEKAGVPVRVCKPVESGCDPGAGDAWQLAMACRIPPRPDQVCAYSFTTPVSPAYAAQKANIRLSMDDVFDFCQRRGRESFLLIEGAGGFYSPLTADGSNADLAQRLGFPLLIVVADRLGCLNHALLTAECARRRGLAVLALVVNETHPLSETPMMNNVGELQRLCSEKVVSLIYPASHPKNRAVLTGLTQAASAGI